MTAAVRPARGLRSVRQAEAAGKLADPPGVHGHNGLARTRPDLVADVLNGLASNYGRPIWRRYRGPTSQLVLTILSQNSADTKC